MITQAKLLVAAIAALGFASMMCPLCGGGVPAAHAQQVVGIAQAPETATVKLHISDMTCGGCAATARLALKKLDGVLDATVIYKDSLGVVRYDPRKVTPAQIAEHLTRLTGYGARVIADTTKGARQPGQ